MSPKKIHSKWNPKGKIMERTGPLFHWNQNDSLFTRDFSCAVSGSFQVFIHSATREKSFFLAAPPLVASAFGRHGRFPPHARKTSGYPGYQNDNIFWWEEENLCLNKRRQDKIRNWIITLLKTKYITICDFIAYKHRWVFTVCSSDIFEQNIKYSATFLNRSTSDIFEAVH